jgi:hypothetical protein
MQPYDCLHRSHFPRDACKSGPSNLLGQVHATTFCTGHNRLARLCVVAIPCDVADSRSIILSAHGIPAFDPIWDEALTRMKSRIDATMSASLAGFPHYADPATGQWVTTTDGFWTGGFWIGELWLAGHYWRDPPYARAAEDWLLSSILQRWFAHRVRTVFVDTTLRGHAT